MSSSQRDAAHISDDHLYDYLNCRLHKKLRKNFHLEKLLFICITWPTLTELLNLTKLKVSAALKIDSVVNEVLIYCMQCTV